MSSTNIPTDLPPTGTGFAWRTCERMIRRLILLGLTVLVILNSRELERRVRFWCTGTVRVDGLVFHLNTDDEFLTEVVLEHGEWEPEDTRLICDRLKRGDTVIDVGANIGWYTIYASRIVGKEGLVVAFEPDPTNFALLKRNVQANGCENVRLEQKALSNERGTLTLFRHESNKGMHSLLTLNQTEDSIEVEAIPQDEYLGNRLHVNLVKMDVEGAEGLVLDGMCRTLSANPHMQVMMEFAPARLRDAGYDPKALLERLVRHGFNVYDIHGAGGQREPTGLNDLFARLARERLAFTNLLLSGTQASVDAVNVSRLHSIHSSGRTISQHHNSELTTGRPAVNIRAAP